MKNERDKWKPELKPEIKTRVFSTIYCQKRKVFND